MSGGGGTTVQKNEIDPQLKALHMQNYANALNVANTSFQPYTGERVAGFNANQLLGHDAFLAAANDPTAINAIGRAQGSVGDLLNYRSPFIANPATVSPGYISAPASIAPGTIAAPNRVTPDNVMAGMLAGVDLSPYSNPYTAGVIDQTIQQQQRARGIQGVRDNAAATAAHAFGGTRQAVQNALTSEGYDRNTSELIANLNSENFRQAQASALGDISRRFAADQFNAGNRLSADQFNATGAYNANAADVANRLSADQFNSMGGYNAALANVANRLSADQFNATGGYNAALANAANDMAGAGLRLNAANQYAALGNDYADQLARRGALYGLVGDQQQQQQQAQNDFDYSEFLRQISYPEHQQDIRNSALGMIPLEQTQTSSSRGRANTAGMIGTGLQAAAIL